MHFSEQAAAAISVLALLGGLALLWHKRRGGVFWPAVLARKGRGALAVEDRLALGTQHSLYIVRAGSNRLLVGTGPGGVSFGPGLEESGTVLGRARARQQESTA